MAGSDTSPGKECPGPRVSRPALFPGETGCLAADKSAAESLCNGERSLEWVLTMLRLDADESDRRERASDDERFLAARLACVRLEAACFQTSCDQVIDLAQGEDFVQPQQERQDS